MNMRSIEAIALARYPTSNRRERHPAIQYDR